MQRYCIFLLRNNMSIKMNNRQPILTILKNLLYILSFTTLFNSNSRFRRIQTKLRWYHKHIRAFYFFKTSFISSLNWYTKFLLSFIRQNLFLKPPTRQISIQKLSLGLLQVKSLLKSLIHKRNFKSGHRVNSSPFFHHLIMRNNSMKVVPQTEREFIEHLPSVQ